MEIEAATPGNAGAEAASSAAGVEPQDVTADDGLFDRVRLIEAQPLAERAHGFEQLHDELLAELQRSDREGA